MIKEKIYYKKARDFGQIFAATIGFMKQNFKPLYGSLLFFAGPFLLLGATISSYMFGSRVNMAQLLQRGDILNFYAELGAIYAITMFVMFIGITAYNVILNRNILENEKLGPDDSLTIRHGVVNFWKDFWRIFGNTLLLLLVLLISVVVLGLVLAGVAALIGTGGSQGGTVIMALLVVILFLFVFLILGPVLAYVPMAALFVCQRDRLPIFAALRKVFYYMKNNFWNTWVVSIVGLLTYSVLAFVAQIPVAIITAVTTFSRIKSASGGLSDSSPSLLLVIATVIGTLLSYGVMVIYHLIAVYQYTSLEEKKEGASIIEKINKIE